MVRFEMNTTNWHRCASSEMKCLRLYFKFTISETIDFDALITKNVRITLDEYSAFLNSLVFLLFFLIIRQRDKNLVILCYLRLPVVRFNSIDKQPKRKISRLRFKLEIFFQEIWMHTVQTDYIPNSYSIRWFNRDRFE